MYAAFVVWGIEDPLGDWLHRAGFSFRPPSMNDDDFLLQFESCTFPFAQIKACTPAAWAKAEKVVAQAA
jgi:hypothetical protein